MNLLLNVIKLTLILSCLPPGRHWLVLLFALVAKFGGAGLMGTGFLWMGELFPTSVRGTAIGMMGVCSRIGGITVPFVIQMVNQLLYLLFSLPQDGLGYR